VSLQSFRVQGTNVTGVLPGITRKQYSNLQSKERLCGSNASGFGRLPQLTDVSIFSTDMSAQCEPNGLCTNIDDALPWYAMICLSSTSIRCLCEGHVLLPYLFCFAAPFVVATVLQPVPAMYMLLAALGLEMQHANRVQGGQPCTSAFM